MRKLKLIVLLTAFIPPNSVWAEGVVVEDAQVSLIQNTFVAAPISGVVAAVKTHEGATASSGDVLVALDDDQARTELEAATAAFDAARLESDNDVDARYATRTLEVRKKELEQSLEANAGLAGVISETEIETQRLVVDQARLAIEQAMHQQNVAAARAVEKQAAVKMAKAKVDKHLVRAPVTGAVVEVVVEPGEWVEVGKPIVRLISLNPIRVECFIDGHKHGPELTGRRVEFYIENRPTQSSDATKLVGEVAFVSPELNPITGEVRLWATVENPDRAVRAGMKGRLVILSE